MIDRRFRFFGIPIQTSFWFFPVMAGIGWSVSEGQFAVILVFMLSMMLAVLAHEFGHALVGRWFGGRGAEVYLALFGGLCCFREANFSRWRKIAMVAAGPLVNLLLGGLAMLALYLGPQAGSARTAVLFLNWFFVVSLFLGALNLIPILPLDGGHILRLLVRPRRLHHVFFAGILMSVAMVLLALGFRDWLMLAVFTFLGWHNTGNFLAWRRLAKYK